MIVTIDGPAGAGKSYVARALARRLAFQFLDTGAMYRTVALAVLRHGCDWNDENEVASLARRIDIAFQDDCVLLDGEDVTHQIREPRVTQATSHIADHAQVRRHLVQLQRSIAAGRDTVTEGRDQGTVAFPDAECKIYLVATPEERARRRWRQMKAGGQTVALEEVLRQQNERDKRDAARPLGGLLKADDAIQVDTDAMTPEQVVDRLEQIVGQHRSAPS